MGIRGREPDVIRITAVPRRDLADQAKTVTKVSASTGATASSAALVPGAIRKPGGALARHISSEILPDFACQLYCRPFASPVAESIPIVSTERPTSASATLVTAVTLTSLADSLNRAELHRVGPIPSASTEPVELIASVQLECKETPTLVATMSTNALEPVFAVLEPLVLTALAASNVFVHLA